MAALEEGLLRKLAEWEVDGLPVTSVYVNADGREYPSREQVYEAMDASLRGVDLEAIEDRDARDSVTRDLERSRAYVRDELERTGVRGAALFSCSGAGLWEAVALPRPVRTSIRVARRPHLLPVEAMLEQLETFCVVVADREKARLFVVSMGQAEEVAALEGDVPGQHDQGGWSQARFQRHIEEHVQRHLKTVRDRVLELDRQRSFDHLVLAGTDELVAELERDLHDYVARKVIDRVPLPIAAGPDEILTHVRRLEEELEARREAEALDRLVHEADAGTGRVTAGLRDTLLALEEGRVDTLVVVSDLELTGVRCTSCGHLAPEGDLCETCGKPTEATDTLAEEALEAALRIRCRVETVARSADMDRLGGIGALLRF